MVCCQQDITFQVIFVCLIDMFLKRIIIRITRLKDPRIVLANLEHHTILVYKLASLLRCFFCRVISHIFCRRENMNLSIKEIFFRIRTVKFYNTFRIGLLHPFNNLVKFFPIIISILPWIIIGMHHFFKSHFLIQFLNPTQMILMWVSVEKDIQLIPFPKHLLHKFGNINPPIFLIT